MYTVIAWELLSAATVLIGLSRRTTRSAAAAASAEQKVPVSAA